MAMASSSRPRPRPSSSVYSQMLLDTVSRPPVLIIGAGATGLIFAQALKRAGIPFQVFEREERAEDNDEVEWTLTVHWALAALEECLPAELFNRLYAVQVDPGTELDEAGSIRTSRVVADPSKAVFVPINRSLLQEILSSGLRIQRGKTLASLQVQDSFQLNHQNSRIVEAIFTDGTKASGSILVGTDGRSSQTRRLILGDGAGRPTSRRGRLTLAGDSAHAMTANRSEGFDHAIADAATLARYLIKAWSRTGDSLEGAVARYENDMRARLIEAVIRGAKTEAESEVRSGKVNGREDDITPAVLTEPFPVLEQFAEKQYRPNLELSFGSETKTMSSSDPDVDMKEKKSDSLPSSTTQSPSPPPTKADPPPPPNGGLIAWLHVLGSFVLYFNTWGFLNAFGIYQSYYESGALFQASSSDISWIGSVEAFILMVTGVFAGPIFDKGYVKTLIVIGGFLVVFGHMMLSLCTTYWQVMLAQAVTIGIGTGLLFVPCVAILPQYFSTKMGMAIGIAAAGSSLGGVIYPIVLYRLIGEVGFPWAVRVEGFIALGMLPIPLTILKMRTTPTKARAMIDFGAFLDGPYIFFVFSSLVAFMGLFVLFFYLSYFAIDQRIGDMSLGFYLVSIFNAGSCFGRALPNALADITGPFNLIAPGSFLVGALSLCVLAVTAEPGLIVIAILSGFISGIMIGVPPLCFFATTRDKSKLGTRMGMGYAIAAFGVLAGGPGAGAILGQTQPLNWTGVWIFGGVSSCAAGLMYAGQRVVQHGWKLTTKA